jgi:serine phosphatase RsbU (regulator of sigma subunit)
MHGDASMFASIFIGVFNLQTSTLTYMNCGHEPPFWIKNGGVIIPLSRTGPAVGAIPGANFSAREISKERLLEILEHGNNCPAGILDSIDEKLRQFTGPTSQFDDITLLAIKRSR